jgi:GAF domain-containing protein
MQNETYRLNALRLYQILDTASEKAFDDLTHLASTICGTPISLVSFVDEKRQWSKSHEGLAVTEIPRDQAFCAHAIQYSEIMVVEDTQQDKRFHKNPLVTGDPNIRFYAGAPLQVASGARLGTLCVIDRVPRTLSDTQMLALETLRDAVVAQLELRRAVNDLRALHDIIPMCAWCRSVRIEGGAKEETEWQPLHEYICSLAPVTHTICSNCAAGIFPHDHREESPTG